MRRALAIAGISVLVLHSGCTSLSKNGISYFDSQSRIIHAEVETKTPRKEQVIEMVRIPGGEFTMGSSSGRSDEAPPHRVKVGDFYLAATEITQGQWTEIMGENPVTRGSREAGCVDCPVVSINGSVDVDKFLARLRDLTGMSFRLPTEAEWEYAARGGGDTPFAGGENAEDVSWHRGNSNGRIHPVGRKRANTLGLHDMTGNVGEWCADWYHYDYYRNSPVEDPPGPATRSSRLKVVRGGSYKDLPDEMTVTTRFQVDCYGSMNTVGTRLALDGTDSESQRIRIPLRGGYDLPDFAVVACGGKGPGECALIRYAISWDWSLKEVARLTVPYLEKIIFDGTWIYGYGGGLVLRVAPDFSEAREYRVKAVGTQREPSVGAIAAEDGILYVAAEHAFIALDGDFLEVDRVDLGSGKDAHDILLYGDQAFLLDNRRMPVWIVRLSLPGGGRMVLQERLFLGNVGHLVGQWLVPEDDLWFVNSTNWGRGGGRSVIRGYSIGEDDATREPRLPDPSLKRAEAEPQIEETIFLKRGKPRRIEPSNAFMLGGITPLPPQWAVLDLPTSADRPLSFVVGGALAFLTGREGAVRFTKIRDLRSRGWESEHVKILAYGNMILVSGSLRDSRSGILLRAFDVEQPLEHINLHALFQQGEEMKLMDFVPLSTAKAKVPTWFAGMIEEARLGTSLLADLEAAGVRSGKEVIGEFIERHGPRILPAAIAAFEWKDEGLPKEILEVVEERREEMFGILIAALGDIRHFVRASAAEILGSLGEGRAEKDLVRMMMSDFLDKSSRMAAAEALEALGAELEEIQKQRMEMYLRESYMYDTERGQKR